MESVYFNNKIQSLYVVYTSQRDEGKNKKVFQVEGRFVEKIQGTLFKGERTVDLPGFSEKALAIDTNDFWTKSEFGQDFLTWVEEKKESSKRFTKLEDSILKDVEYFVIDNKSGD